MYIIIQGGTTALNFDQIDDWIVSPYKSPEKECNDNEIFNNYVSMVHVHSEHAIGYLKGHFQSLKCMQVTIKDEATHKFATYWATACIVLHSFTMQRKAEERGDDDNSSDMDPFVALGLSSDDEE